MRILLACLLCLVGLSGCGDPRPMPPREFAEEYAKAVRVAAPGASVSVKADLEVQLRNADGTEATAFLDNAYAAYVREPRSLPEVIKMYVASTVAARQPESKVDPSRIVPVIKDRPWLAETRLALKGRGKGDPLEHVFDDFNDELVVVYAEDSPTSLRYLTPKDLDSLGVERTQLRKLAVDNLERILPPIQVHPGPLASMVTAGGDLEASVLLLDKFWSSGKVKVDGDIVVAIPARDLLLVTGSRNAAGISKVRQTAAKAMRETPYRLTDTLFVYRDGRFSRLESPGKP